jgi:hypothetical protein
MLEPITGLKPDQHGSAVLCHAYASLTEPCCMPCDVLICMWCLPKFYIHAPDADLCAAGAPWYRMLWCCTSTHSAGTQTDTSRGTQTDNSTGTQPVTSTVFPATEMRRAIDV